MKFTTPVIKGHGRGKTLGFPTFNLQIPADLQHKHGIYAGFVWIDKQKYPGAFHFGPIPVFSDSSPHLEVFVLDYNSHLPLDSLTFELVRYLRPIQNFSSPQALTTQISLDVTATRAMLH